MAEGGRLLLSVQKMPSIGFGTSELVGEVARRAVTTAIRAGYRLVDTARIYDNEVAVGEAARVSGVPREELFITTKVWNDDLGYESTLAACDASLERLRVDYVDLYLIHWPATSRRGDSWRALIELTKRGKVKAIGVSNYTVRHLQELLAASDTVPAVNQVEFHPFIYKQQRELLQFCQRHGIIVEAYSPLSRIAAGLGVPPVIHAIANRTGKTLAQVVLRWCIQHGTVPLPRSRNPEHIQTNFEVFDFELDDDAMRSLDGLSDGERVTWDPATMH